MSSTARRSRAASSSKSKKASAAKRRTKSTAKPRSRTGSTKRARSSGSFGSRARSHVTGWLGKLNWGRLVSFPVVVLVLIGLVIVVHDIRVVDGSEHSSDGVRFNQPRAELASFEHSKSRTAEEVRALRLAYVDAYGPLAVAEMRAHGIPASITLAQGLLESVAGTSRLASRTNNHFGIKCFSKSCAPGHCTNFDDDHHKDFFRVYDHPAQSYRAHSAFLMNGKRYASLFNLADDDYKGWARGLSKAGYATDPKYADKLIGLVERYDLDDWD